MNRILHIENDASWGKLIKELLEATFELELKVEWMTIDDFRSTFVSAEDFEGVVACIIDVELEYDFDPREVNDTKGRDEVLPRVRFLAPWVPTICNSRYVTQNPVETLNCSLADFDAVLPKSAVFSQNNKLHHLFNLELWNRIIRGCELKRACWSIGSTPAEIEQRSQSNMEIELAQNVPENATFARLLRTLGLEGEKIIVEATSPGFSGLNTCVSHVEGRSIEHSFDNTWFLKWGPNVAKLYAETEAHSRVLKSGVDRSLLAWPLARHPLVIDAIGVIGYLFEERAQTLMEFAQENDERQVVEQLEAVVQGLFVNRTETKKETEKVLSEWFGQDGLVGAQTLIGPDCPQGGVRKLSYSLVHGDLHFRNILVSGGSPVVIDWAKSRQGPIALDIAKLIVDYYATVVGKAFTLPVSLEALGGESVVVEYLVNQLPQEDQDVLPLLINGYMCKYLSYPDVDESFKSPIRVALQIAGKA